MLQVATVGFRLSSTAKLTRRGHHTPHRPWFSRLLLQRCGFRVNGQANLARSCSEVAVVISSQGKSTESSRRRGRINLFMARGKETNGANARILCSDLVVVVSACLRGPKRGQTEGGGRHWRGSLCIVARYVRARRMLDLLGCLAIDFFLC